MNKLWGVLEDILITVLKKKKYVIVQFLSSLFKLKNLLILFWGLIASGLIGVIIYIYKDEIFILKFKEEVHNIPQSIEQNIKEDLIIGLMKEYVKECGGQGVFLYSRVEVKNQMIDVQVKEILGYNPTIKTSINLLELDVKLKRFMLKKSRASNSLTSLLLEAKEGKVYVIDRGWMEVNSVNIEPFSNAFYMLHREFVGFKYITVLHNKLGLIILFGFLEFPSNEKLCNNVDIHIMLEDLYKKYKF